ncbi:MAG: transcription-repair coupling factor [Bacteroidales bacterium]|nr:transcription-repair coupling factor [Bacteroidales bacterium]
MHIQDLLTKYIKREDLKEITQILGLTASQRISFKGLSGSSKSMIAGALYKLSGKCIMFIMNDKESAAYFYNDLEVILNETDKKPEERSIFFFPDSYKRLIRADNLDHTNILTRTEVLNMLTSPSKNRLFIITYPEALSEKIISRKDFTKSICKIGLNDSVKLDELIALLNDNHFQRVDFTIEPGQFSVRGGIVDVFSYGFENPFRIEFSGNEIESLRTFDVLTQMSVEKFQKIKIIPNITLHESMTERSHFFSFLPSDTIIGFENAAYITAHFSEIWNHLEQESGKEKLAELSLEKFVTPSEFKKSIEAYNIIDMGMTAHFENTVFYSFNTTPQPVFSKNFDLLVQNLKINNDKNISNLIFSSADSQIKRLQSIFEDISYRRKAKGKFEYSIVQASIHQGFVEKDMGLAFYTDHEIFERYHRYRLRSGFAAKQAFTLKELSNLTPGDYVTHIDHGIGRFDGLEKVMVNGKEQEALRIVYKDEDLLYISIHSLHRISKYIGKDAITPVLSKIGSPAWQNLKNKTKARVKDIAKDLIALYAKRKTAPGNAFMPDTYLQHELEASFIYEDTPDQIKATADVKKDLETSHPMDRLVCGDVGFGKTEIAIRAAFKVVSESKQVAVLVPTTILALQHYNTFKERLKDFPCTIDYVSRLKSTSKIKDTIKNLESGHIDIIIGTHRLVSKDVKFKDLGLLIIDEEQKFGVGIKEKLKELKVNVDTLTLTATPIPRTLQFSMMGARDLSVINTPPPNRYPVITELISFNEDIIKEAISYEIGRGGQIFFVNNRIQNIYELAETLKRWLPKLKIAIGHGQMQGPELEQVMIDFTEGLYDILLATTIIESGLDIPNVNTIFINNAQNYGLSELHQLRGRVGRSNKKAFCYLICPPLITLSNEARKRIKAIQDFSDLGSGMNIAMRDLDIRGAGNLLGAEQSGFISEIGFEMYHRILDEAIQELKETELKDLFVDNSDVNSTSYVKDTLFESDLEILIPSDYITNITERLLIYKTINDLSSEEELHKYELQLEDRFGRIPQQTQELFNVVRLRWLAKKIGFSKITLKNNCLNCYFVQNLESDYFASDIFIKVLDFVKKNPVNCSLKEIKNKPLLSFSEIMDMGQALQILKNLNQYI